MEVELGPARGQTSRRDLLAGLAAFGAGLFTPRSARSGTASAAAATRLVDVHHHVFPPEYLKAFVATYDPRNQALASGWTPQGSLAAMDENGIATAIVSLTSPGTWIGEAQASRNLTRKCNEYLAQLGRDHAGRFGFFAALPLPDPEGSLQELAHALDVLKADGIGLMTSYGGRYPGDPAFAPVFEELNRRKAVVHFHPNGSNGSRRIVPGVPGVWAEMPQETSRAILSLLVSGSLAKLPDVRFVFSHAGGTLPMITGRIGLASGLVEGLAEKAPRGLEQELKRFHYDIAGAADRAALSALTSLVPTSQVLFGSDYPLLPISATAGGIGRVGLSAADLDSIRRGNAVALLPRLGA